MSIKCERFINKPIQPYKSPALTSCGRSDKSKNETSKPLTNTALQVAVAAKISLCAIPNRITHTFFFSFKDGQNYKTSKLTEKNNT